MKLKRCPNMHYYDADKYPQCPHCAEQAEKQQAAAVPQPEPVAVPQPEPVAAPQPEPVAAPQPEPVAARQPEPVAAPQPEPVAAPQPNPAAVPQTDEAWVCTCGARSVGKFCMSCGKPKNAPAPAPVPVPQPEPASGASLTSYINEVGFTGNIEDAKAKAAPPRDDEGATQIIFDELADGLVLGWLVAVSANLKGKVFSVTETRSTVGRSDAEHMVTIDLHGDKTVSRGAQAMLLYDPLNKKFFIQSTDSKTIIYLNRQMLLMPAELKAYDRLLLGETELLFVPLCSEHFSW